jgi:hypothetical protein
MLDQSRRLRIPFAAAVAAVLLGLPAAFAAQTANGISSPAAGAAASGTVNAKSCADNPAC